MPAHTATADLASVNPALVPGLTQALWLRTIVLLAAGAVIAFTATMHADPHFAIVVIGASLLALGIATFVEYGVQRRQPVAWLVASRATVTLLAGAVMFVLLGVLVAQTAADQTPVSVINPVVSAEFATLTALVLAVWAFFSVAITLTQMYRHTLPKNVALPSAALSAVLVLVVLLFRDDFVAIIGFFGAYAVVRAVFLGISVFDMKSPSSSNRTLAAA